MLNNFCLSFSESTELAENAKQTVLANGVKMPKVGFGTAFGTWSGKEGERQGFSPEEATFAVNTALRAGYTHLDCALVYLSQPQVGRALANQFAEGKKRSDFFITSKVAHPEVPLTLNRLGKSFDWAMPIKQMKERVLHDIEVCLFELGLGYLDLLLVHWPGNFTGGDASTNRKKRAVVWSALEEAYKAGMVRAIGVSNFTAKHLETFLQDVEIKPMVNQVEMSPYMFQKDIYDMCKKHSIQIVAWAPLGNGSDVLKDPTIVQISKDTGKNVGQVILRWLIQQGLIVLPKSGNEDRMRGNLDIFDFTLDESQMAKMSALNKGKSTVTDANGIP